MTIQLPKSPLFSKDNQIEEEIELIEQVVWQECEDVYKAEEKSIEDFRKYWGIESAEFREVYISQEALDAIAQHLELNFQIEQGGILFGCAYTDPNFGIYVTIIASVAAPATISSGMSLEFSSESWQFIMDYANSAHPDANMVGWYHSHPNLGAFMSGTDLRTQEAFFSHPWCLAIVYDPVQKDIGYFLGKNAKPVKPIFFKATPQSKPVFS